jgi:hypothetical protein
MGARKSSDIAENPMRFPGSGILLREGAFVKRRGRPGAISGGLLGDGEIGAPGTI